MKRSKVHTFLYLLYNFVSDKLAAHKFLCSMYDAMTYCLDILQCRKNAGLLIQKRIYHCLDSHGVVIHRHFLHNLVLPGSLMFDTSYLHADSLDETLGKQIINFFVLHIKKLILE